MRKLIETISGAGKIYADAVFVADAQFELRVYQNYTTGRDPIPTLKELGLDVSPRPPGDIHCTP
jgi:hypothetical protein